MELGARAGFAVPMNFSKILSLEFTAVNLTPKISQTRAGNP
jgi:hypothetical protein